MDLHVPEGPIRSLKDFLLHIVIVTIGILIALGLEQAVEAHNRAHLAHEAVDEFHRELTGDMADLDVIESAGSNVLEAVHAVFGDQSHA